MMASVTAFLNCLQRQVCECRQAGGESSLRQGRDREGTGWTHLIARYMGRMAKSGKVCTLIMMVMKAMYSRTLMKPGEERESAAGHRAGRHAGRWHGSEEAPAPVTCEQLRVEHVYSLIVPGVLALEVHGVQHILDEDGEHHGHQDGILEGDTRRM